jgi:hypothetical protein
MIRAKLCGIPLYRSLGRRFQQWLALYLKSLTCSRPGLETLGPGTRLLHGFALADVPALLVELSRIIEEAPLRQMARRAVIQCRSR